MPPRRSGSFSRPEHIESVGSSVRARGESLSSSHSAEPLPGHALGSLAAPHASTLNSHIGQVGPHQTTMGNRLSGHGDNMHQTAANIRQNESDIANNMRSIQNRSNAPLPIPPRTSSVGAPTAVTQQGPSVRPLPVPPRSSSLGAPTTPTSAPSGHNAAPPAVHQAPPVPTAPPPPPPMPGHIAPPPTTHGGGGANQGTSTSAAAAAPPPPPPHVPPPPTHAPPPPPAGGSAPPTVAGPSQNNRPPRVPRPGLEPVNRNDLYQSPSLAGAPDRPINATPVQAYQNHLGLQQPPRIVRVPPGQNLTVNDPLSRIPASHQQGFSQQDQNRPLGEALWGMQPHQLDGSPIDQHVSGAGGGGYSHNTGVTTLDSRTDDRTLYHELGHQRQNENGLNDGNTNRIVLEYHNVLHNENNMPGATQQRIDYGLGGGPLYPRPGEDWASMRQHVNGTLPAGQQAGTNQALNEIEQATNSGSPTDNLIRQNLVTQYYRNQRN